MLHSVSISVSFFPCCTFLDLHFFHYAFFSCCTLFVLHFSCCTFSVLHSFHVSLFLSLFISCSCCTFSFCTFFLLLSFNLALFLSPFILHVFFVFHFFSLLSCCIHVSLFFFTLFELHSCFTFFLHSFQVACMFYFFVLNFMLHFFHDKLFPCCTLFMFCHFHVELFSSCTLFMFHPFHIAIVSCCSFSLLLYYYHAAFLYCTLPRKRRSRSKPKARTNYEREWNFTLKAILYVTTKKKGITTTKTTLSSKPCACFSFISISETQIIVIIFEWLLKWKGTKLFFC